MLGQRLRRCSQAPLQGLLTILMRRAGLPSAPAGHDSPTPVPTREGQAALLVRPTQDQPQRDQADDIEHGHQHVPGAHHWSRSLSVASAPGRALEPSAGLLYAPPTPQMLLASELCGLSGTRRVLPMTQEPGLPLRWRLLPSALGAPPPQSIAGASAVLRRAARGLLWAMWWPVRTFSPWAGSLPWRSTVHIGYPS